MVGSGLDRDKLFGATRFGSPFIWVKEGADPPAPGPAAARFFGFLGALLFSLWLLIRRWRRRE